MKTNLLITVASAAVLASAMACAAPSSVSDDALDSIAGKGNNTATFTSTAIGVTLASGNGDVQIGFYQWNDDHNTDSSYAKGGNTANGTSSNVQNGVTSLNNIFGWGAAAQVATTVGGALAGTFDSESWGTLMVGGF